MRLMLVICIAFLIFEVRAIRGQETSPSYCPQTARLSGNPTDHWFEGTIGPKHVRMYMERGGQDVVGLYYDVADWKPILLGGKWTDDGNIQVTTSLPALTAIGALDGRLSPAGDFVGVLTTRDGNDREQQSVALRRVPQPSCSGSGAWQRFSNPKVPIAFSYPTSWHVEINEPDIPNSTNYESVMLMCPDPMTLAYDMSVGFRPEEKSKDNTVSDFIRFNGGPWLYGCDSDSRDSCQTPIVTHRGGITFYRADEIEFRTYCVEGGYVGQGEGHRFLLYFDDNWIQLYGSGAPSHMMERILSTIQIKK